MKNRGKTFTGSDSQAVFFHDMICFILANLGASIEEINVPYDYNYM